MSVPESSTDGGELAKSVDVMQGQSVEDVANGPPATPSLSEVTLSEITQVIPPRPRLSRDSTSWDPSRKLSRQITSWNPSRRLRRTTTTSRRNRLLGVSSLFLLTPGHLLANPLRCLVPLPHLEDFSTAIAAAKGNAELQQHVLRMRQSWVLIGSLLAAFFAALLTLGTSTHSACPLRVCTHACVIGRPLRVLYAHVAPHRPVPHSAVGSLERNERVPRTIFDQLAVLSSIVGCVASIAGPVQAYTIRSLLPG